MKRENPLRVEGFLVGDSPALCTDELTPTIWVGTKLGECEEFCAVCTGLVTLTRVVIHLWIPLFSW